MNPTTITIGTDEYKKLEAVAKMLEVVSPHKAIYEVSDTYFDLGQDWVWTTIIRYGYRECQILSPKQWGNILMAETIADLTAAVEDIRNDEYFGDK